MCFPVSFVKFLRTPFFTNISGGYFWIRNKNFSLFDHQTWLQNLIIAFGLEEEIVRRDKKGFCNEFVTKFVTFRIS